MRKRDAERLQRRLIKELNPTYDLIYVGQGDHLGDKQVQALVVHEDADLGNEDWEFDSRQSGIDYVVEDITTEEEREALEHYDLMEDLRSAIDERESGSWFRQLVRQTPDPLLRATILDEDDSLSFQEVSVDHFLTRVGLPDTEVNRKAAGSVIANASPEFTVCMVFALITGDLLTLIDMPHEVEEVWLVNPDIWMGSSFTGSGWCESFEGRIKMSRAALHMDKGGNGYGWQDVVSQTWQTSNSEIIPIPGEGQYMQCGAHVPAERPPWERCWLFVEENPSLGDSPDLAEYIHLARGDEADDALEDTHQAQSSNDVHSLDWWRQYGPDKMKERFTA